MNRIYVLLIFLLISLSARSQEDICIGKRFSIFSETLNEEREYWLYLPDSYAKETEKQYPVIYLLDASNFFTSLVGFQQAYSKSRIPVMSECIIVGVVSGKDRAKDFTPTKSSYLRDGTKLSPEKAIGGGGEDFSTFLGKELRDEINRTYRINGRNILVGHSYSALFTLSTLLCHTEMFTTYIAFDPSLWWDDMYVIKQAETLFRGKNMTGISLYLGFGGKMRPDEKDFYLPSVERFRKEVLPIAKENGLLLIDKSFPNDNHGTIMLSGLADAFKVLPASIYQQ